MLSLDHYLEEGLAEALHDRDDAGPARDLDDERLLLGLLAEARLLARGPRTTAQLADSAGIPEGRARRALRAAAARGWIDSAPGRGAVVHEVRLWRA